MDTDLTDRQNTYVYPITDDAEIGQLIITGKHIFEVMEIDISNQLMLVQKVM